MNINNHAKLIKLESVGKKVVEEEVKVTMRPVMDSLVIHHCTDPVKLSLNEVMAQIDLTQPNLFTLVSPIHTEVDHSDIFADGHHNVQFYGEFTQLLLKTFIRTEIVCPVDPIEGYAKGVGRILKEEQNRDGSYGPNNLSQEEIGRLIADYPKYNIIDHGEEVMKREDYLYLPITNVDMNRDEIGFDMFPEQFQVTIRSALQLSSYKTYIKIILLDGSEFISWYSDLGLITIGKYK